MTPCIPGKPDKHRCGYASKRKNGKLWLAHQLAWIEAYGPIPQGMEVCHSCDNRACANLDHLFLGTHQANMADCKAKGRFVRPCTRGSLNGNAKLTEETAVYAMARLLAGESQKSVAGAFGVSQVTVCTLWSGKAWGWLFRESAL